MVKNPPAVWETWVQSLGWEDPLKEGMETHSSILALEHPMDRGVWQATVHRVTQSRKQLKRMSTIPHIHPVIMYGCESWTVKKAELMLLNCSVGEDS